MVSGAGTKADMRSGATGTKPLRCLRPRFFPGSHRKEKASNLYTRGPKCTEHILNLAGRRAEFSPSMFFDQFAF
jgi:hypothetical protein